MIRKILSILLIFLLFSCSADSISVLKVIDGDTVIISTGEHVRYIGINAPEIGMPFYEEAKRENEELVLERKVKIEFDRKKRDQYGRILAYIFVGRIFVNYELLRKGFVFLYRDRENKKYRNLLIEAETEAIENKRGLWRDFHKIPIRIEEVNYNPEGRDEENLNGEYVVLKNISGKRIDISNFSIKDESHNMFIFPDGSYIEGGGEVLVYTGRGVKGNGKFFFNSTHPIWNNDYDTAYLMNAKGNIVDFYRY